MQETQTPAVILLKDGTVFKGLACGKTGTTTGEIAFNTGMTGYQEIFTDPSYSGQIVVMASPHIGNYGVEASEVESNGCKIKGLVTKKFSTVNSRYRETDTLQNYLVNDNVVGIMDVDTRALVKHIRDNGAQNAIISSETTDISTLKAQLDKIPSMKGMELASTVSTKEAYTVGESSAKYKVALLDLGVKQNIIRSLVARDCFVKVFPYNTSYEKIKEFTPNGVLLSNGPGDPEPLTEVISTVGKLVEANYPIFGICLGHQVLAISQGLTTEKMHNGHRGINHPIKNLISGKCEITSQNHGFVVRMQEAIASEKITVTHQHLNDETLAGISVNDKNAFSVQYHPEASPGPHDSRYLFDQFITNINNN